MKLLLLLGAPKVFFWGQALLGVMVLAVFVYFLVGIWRDWQLSLSLKKKEKTDDNKKAEFVFSSEYLTPMEWREKLLNNIDDGRLYQITSPHELVIACAKEYNAEEDRLSCYAYYSISERGVYIVSNLHVSDPCGKPHSREFVGNIPLNIYYDQDPGIIMSKDVMISPFVTDGDYNRFVFYMLKAGIQWNIERSEQHRLGSYAYRLKTKEEQ